jgi:hypothetical protein
VRPQEITMLTRRIAAGACALCLVVPAAAGARPGAEAALFAALALVSAMIARARRSAPRVGM